MNIIQRMNLASVDLNLLVAFDALMTHRHVTRAGESIGLSQPAMSNALSRLRGLFDDQILVRTRAGMTPTPLALQLHDPIRVALKQIEHSLNGEREFDAGTAVRTFRVAISEDEAFHFLPRLHSHLAEQAPGVTLDILSTATVAANELLTRGECDLAIGRIHVAAPAHIRSHDLFTQQLACMARTGHPAFDGALSLDEYLAYPHIQVKPSRRAFSRVDEALSEIGLSRRIAVTVSLYMVAPFMIADTDLIATMPERLAAAIEPTLDVVVRRVPLELEPMVTSLGWHQRHDEEPAHRWFRALVEDVSQRP